MFSIVERDLRNVFEFVVIVEIIGSFRELSGRTCLIGFKYIFRS